MTHFGQQKKSKFSPKKDFSSTKMYKSQKKLEITNVYVKFLFPPSTKKLLKEFYEKMLSQEQNA